MPLVEKVIIDTLGRSLHSALGKTLQSTLGRTIQSPEYLLVENFTLHCMGLENHSAQRQKPQGAVILTFFFFFPLSTVLFSAPPVIPSSHAGYVLTPSEPLPHPSHVSRPAGTVEKVQYGRYSRTGTEILKLGYLYCAVLLH